ncbi:MAG: nucleotidyltransferase family protein [Thermoanaerobaculia bacterium]
MGPSLTNLTAGRLRLAPDRVAEFCRRHRVRRLGLFGSVLRQDFGPESDVDVLVEFEPGGAPGFFELGEMREELSSLVGRPVDLRTPRSISPYFRDRVLREAVLLHDAA